MGNGMNKIMPGLFIGNFRDAKDPKQLEENKITHIIAIHDHAKPELENISYLCIDAADSPSEKLLGHFSKCIDFIHNARKNNGNVLVHCIAGVSRSCTVSCAYLMVISGVEWSDAILACRKAREQVNPNYGFQKQLQSFQESGVQTVREEIIEKYGPLNNEDRTFIQQQVATYDETINCSTNNPQQRNSMNADLALGTTPTFDNYERKRLSNQSNEGKDKS